MQDSKGRSSYQAAPSSSAIISSSGGMNGKESLYLSAISKERSKPPSLLLTTAKGAVHLQMTFAYMNCGIFKKKMFLKVTWEVLP